MLNDDIIETYIFTTESILMSTMCKKIAPSTILTNPFSIILKDYLGCNINMPKVNLITLDRIIISKADLASYSRNIIPDNVLLLLNGDNKYDITSCMSVLFYTLCIAARYLLINVGAQVPIDLEKEIVNCLYLSMSSIANILESEGKGDNMLFEYAVQVLIIDPISIIDFSKGERIAKRYMDNMVNNTDPSKAFLFRRFYGIGV